MESKKANLIEKLAASKADIGNESLQYPRLILATMWVIIGRSPKTWHLLLKQSRRLIMNLGLFAKIEWDQWHYLDLQAWPTILHSQGSNSGNTAATSQKHSSQCKTDCQWEMVLGGFVFKLTWCQPRRRDDFAIERWLSILFMDNAWYAPRRLCTLYDKVLSGLGSKQYLSYCYTKFKYLNLFF